MTEYIKAKYYPKGSDNIIKEQYIIGSEVYIITLDGFKWKLFKNGSNKKIIESKDHEKMYENIPNYR